MLPAYNLVIDITAMENLSEKQFREQVASSLAYLEALKGSLRSDPCRIEYYPPEVLRDVRGNEFWSVRVIVLISLGKKRGESLLDLYKAIVRLIEFELPQFEIEAETGIFHFDNPGTGHG
jgi:hypothetical protein